MNPFTQPTVAQPSSELSWHASSTRQPGSHLARRYRRRQLRGAHTAAGGPEPGPRNCSAGSTLPVAAPPIVGSIDHPDTEEAVGLFDASVAKGAGGHSESNSRPDDGQSTDAFTGAHPTEKGGAEENMARPAAGNAISEVSAVANNDGTNNDGINNDGTNNEAKEESDDDFGHEAEHERDEDANGEPDDETHHETKAEAHVQANAEDDGKANEKFDFGVNADVHVQTNAGTRPEIVTEAVAEAVAQVAASVMTYPARIEAACTGYRLGAPSSQRRARRAWWPRQRGFPLCRRPRPVSRLWVGLLSLCFSGAALAVDVNVATLDQLRSIKGIGPKTAELIIEERTRAGRYESIEDLSERVKGIGPKKAATMQSAGLRVGTASGIGATTSSVGKAKPTGESKGKPTDLKREARGKPKG